MNISSLNAKSKLMLLILLGGLVYSIFMNPMSTEHVEFGETLAGMIPISRLNGFFVLRQAEPTLQVVLPAILLKIGVPPKALALLFSALTQMVPFFGLGLLVFFLTENWVISYFSIIAFLGTVSPMNHFYPLSFPADFFAFGNLANWFVFLCLGLLLNGYKRTGAVLTGLMISIHIPWALPAILYFLYFLRGEKQKKILILFFLFGVVMSAASFFPYQYFEKNFFEKSIYSVADPTPAPQVVLKKPPVEVVKTPEAKAEDASKKKVWTGHNPELFSGSWSADILQFGRLMQFSLLSFLLGFYLVKSKLLSKAKVNMVLIPYIWIFFAVLAGLAFIEITGYYDVLAHLQELAMRAIPNRFLNLSFVFYDSLMIAALASLFFKSQNPLFKAVVIIAAYALIKRPYELCNYLVLFVLVSKYLENYLAPLNAKLNRIIAK